MRWVRVSMLSVVTLMTTIFHIFFSAMIYLEAISHRQSLHDRIQSLYLFVDVQGRNLLESQSSARSSFVPQNDRWHCHRHHRQRVDQRGSELKEKRVLHYFTSWHCYRAMYSVYEVVIQFSLTVSPWFFSRSSWWWHRGQLNFTQSFREFKSVIFK